MENLTQEAVKETAKAVTKVAANAPGGMKVVGISAAATVAVGTGLYFGGKAVKKALKGKIHLPFGKKKAEDIDDPEVAKVDIEPDTAE